MNVADRNAGSGAVRISCSVQADLGFPKDFIPTAAQARLQQDALESLFLKNVEQNVDIATDEQQPVPGWQVGPSEDGPWPGAFVYATIEDWIIACMVFQLFRAVCVMLPAGCVRCLLIRAGLPNLPGQTPWARQSGLSASSSCVGSVVSGQNRGAPGNIFVSGPATSAASFPPTACPPKESRRSLSWLRYPARLGSCYPSRRPETLPCPVVAPVHPYNC